MLAAAGWRALQAGGDRRLSGNPRAKKVPVARFLRRYACVSLDFLELSRKTKKEIPKGISSLLGAPDWAGVPAGWEARFVG